MKHVTGVYEALIEAVTEKGYDVIIPILAQMRISSVPTLRHSAPKVGEASYACSVGDRVLVTFYNNSLATAIIIGAVPSIDPVGPLFDQEITACQYIRYGTSYMQLDQERAALAQGESYMELTTDQVHIDLPQAAFTVNNDGLKYEGPLSLELAQDKLTIGPGTQQAALAAPTLQALQALATAIRAMAPLLTDPASGSAIATAMEAVLQAQTSALPAKNLYLQ